MESNVGTGMLPGSTVSISIGELVLFELVHWMYKSAQRPPVIKIYIYAFFYRINFLKGFGFRRLNPSQIIIKFSGCHCVFHRHAW